MKVCTSAYAEVRIDNIQTCMGGGVVAMIRMHSVQG